MTGIALTHAVGERFPDCELTYVDRRSIDLGRARQQHADYCDALRACGAEVQVLDVNPEHPDAVFVEDAVVVLDELAIATSMGAASRRDEVARLIPILARYRPVTRMPPPATLDGGDVLRVGRTLFVGRSSRTSDAGIAALADSAVPLGYRVVPVALRGCLHLKTACTALADDLLIANPAWVDLEPFAGMRVLAAPSSEPFGANVLPVGASIVASSSHPQTIALVERERFAVRRVDISELEKAEAGVTCLSVVFRANAG